MAKISPLNSTPNSTPKLPEIPLEIPLPVLPHPPRYTARLIQYAPQTLEALKTARDLLMRVSADDPICDCYQTEADVAEIEKP